MMQFYNKVIARGPSITSSSPLLSGEVNYPYLAFIGGTGGAQPYTFGIVSGALAAGLTLSSSGVIAGIPLSAQVDNFGVQITDASGAKSSIVVFNLTIIPAVQITTASPLPSGTQGIGYSTTLAASSGLAPYAWSILSQSGLNAYSITGGGVLTASSPAAETDTVVIQVQDAMGATISKSFSITIAANPLVITTTSIPNGTSGTLYATTTLAATGGVTPYTWTVSPALVSGMSLSTAGVLSGTPTNTSANTTSYTFSVTDHAGTVTPKVFTITFAASSGAQIPAQAQALGFTQQAFYVTPTTSDISYTTSGVTNLYSGLYYNSAPYTDSTHYSDTANGLAIALHGTLATQRQNSTQGLLPYLAGSVGWCVQWTQYLSDNNADHFAAVWMMPMEHDLPGSDHFASDPAGFRRWIELDVNETGYGTGPLGTVLRWFGFFSEAVTFNVAPSGTSGTLTLTSGAWPGDTATNYPVTLSTTNTYNMSFTKGSTTVTYSLSSAISGSPTTSATVSWTAINNNNYGQVAAVDYTQPQVFTVTWNPATTLVTYYLNGTQTFQNNLSDVAYVIEAHHYYLIMNAASHGANTAYQQIIKNFGAWIPPAASWKTLAVGSGGFVRGMTIAADGTMVNRTDTNGAFIYNSASSTWNQLFNVNSLPSSFVNNVDINDGNGTSAIGAGCFEIMIAPTNTQIFYAGYNGQVWKTVNQGAAWTLTGFTQNLNGLPSNADQGAGGNGHAQYGQRMAIDPNNANIVFLGTVGSGLWFTTNGGTSWTQISTSTIPVGSGSGITGILFNAAGTVTGGVTQTIYAASTGHGVYVSNNAGSTWTLTSGGPTDIQYAAIDSAGNYYAAGNAGAHGFKYSGGTWATLLAPDSGDTFQAVAINPFNNNEVVFTGVGGQPYISNNAGSTFAVVNRNTSLVATDIPWLLDANSFGGSPSPYFYLDTGGMAFSPVTNGTLYLSGGTGMWKMNLPANSNASTALTWTDFSIGIEQIVANEICVAPVSGSVPALAGWDRPFFFSNSPTTYPSTYLPVNSDTISYGWGVDYASSNPSYVFGWSTGGTADAGNQSGYTTNNGATWNYFPSNWSAASGTIGGSIAASSPTNIIVVVPGKQPGYTTNGGSSWAGVTLPGSPSWSGFFSGAFYNQRPVTADRVTANTFYLYYPGQGVYISTNSGATWTQQKSGYIESNASWAGYNSKIKSVPSNAGNLFYTPGNQSNQTFSGGSTVPLYRSTNSGVTWTAVTNVTGVQDFNFGAVAPSTTYPSIYIVGYVSNVFGVWVSTDNASTWTNLGNPNAAGENLKWVNCIAADPNNFGRVYVGTHGAGYEYYG